MVIDTSAIIAILLGEPGAKQITKAILYDHKHLMSAFSVLESGLVVESKKGNPGGRELDPLLHRLQVEVVGMNADQS